MIVDQLKSILTNKTNQNPLFVRSLLKETLQDDVLNFVYNDAHYKTLVFTGGTCLRKIYGLPRLSEDLDFNFSSKFKIEDFALKVQDYFQSELQYKEIKVKISGQKQTVFLKFPVPSQLGLSQTFGGSPILFVPCDFNKQIIGRQETEVNSVSTREFSFFVLSYNLPTLFANKITAFLQRNFRKGKEQTVPFKGRDLFDLVWFLEKSKKNDWQLKPNWQRLKKGLEINNPQKITELVVQKVESINKKDVTADLLPFIESSQTLENFSENFSAIIKENFKNVMSL